MPNPNITLERGMRAGRSRAVKTKRRQRELARLLAAERIRNGLSQADLAKLLRRSQSWVARLEKAERRVNVDDLVELMLVIRFDTAAVLERLAKV